MNTTKKIDYSKFRCEIYSPEGVFIKEASFNQKNDFYCPELVPGQKYFLVFSYDEMFVDCFSFKCETAGKVVYLSTGHLFFNKDYEKIPKENRSKHFLRYDVPGLKEVLLENVIHKLLRKSSIFNVINTNPNEAKNSAIHSIAKKFTDNSQSGM